MNRIFDISRTVQIELEEEPEHSTEELAEAARVRHTLAVSRAEAALRMFELLTLHAEYESTYPGRDVDNIVARLQKLLSVCET